jgi:hypothetical protein
MKLSPLHLPLSSRIKKALAKLLSYILNQRLQTFALLDLNKSHMEAKEKGVDHLQVFWW